MTAAVAAVVIACSQGATSGPTGPAPGGEIFLEAVGDAGPDPFTPSVTSSQRPPLPVPTELASEPASPSEGPPLVQSYTGGDVGLYGGSLNKAECDVEQLIGFLEASAAKAAAWAGVEGIPSSELRPYIEKLTSVILLGDTRVTNHGYRADAAVARQSVLQAGTAVLVDDLGVPRARCTSGSPLLEPVPVPTTPAFQGPPWPGFSKNRLTKISPSAKPLPSIPIVDTSTGKVFRRPVGTRGPQDTPVTASPEPSSTPSLTASPVPSVEATPPGPGEGQPVGREPLVPSDLTGFGAVSASSIDPNYPIGLAVDVDLSTSWFSIGPHTTSTVTTYEWSVSGPVEIGAIIVMGNGDNATAAFRTGFGFRQMSIEVLRNGQTVATATGAMSGVDPSVVAEFPAGTTGDAVRLSFTGHESLDCGGIGELLVLNHDWRADEAILSGLGYG